MNVIEMIEREIIIFDNHKIPRKLRGKTIICQYVEEDKEYATDTDTSKNHYVTIYSPQDNILELRVGRRYVTHKNFNLWLPPKSYSLKEIKQSGTANS